MSEGFFEVGCRTCGKGDGWKVYTDGKGRFKFTHPCGHEITIFAIIPPGPVKDEPDPKAYDMRMFT